ncbi:hypothetical protein [Rhodoferax sp.]|uniref:hypothetical protein n=1 Tax=Rhodoferax sp. TaxID=50421 RepID=UPI0027708B54|nr:hypothetical protein [Rhodoferax sp.]
MTPCRNLISMGLLLGVLAACSSTPPPPDWQSNAHGALKGFTASYLSGNTAAAEIEFSRARTEIASTGRADLVARAELLRCAARLASLELDDCPEFQTLAADADARDRAYADYLGARWQGLDGTLLPVQHQAVLALSDAQADAPVLAAIEDPLARLVAAGALLRQTRLSPAGIELATEAASSQGWRRPLLAWLGVQLQRSQQAGDQAGAVGLQRRIDLVLGKVSTKP